MPRVSFSMHHREAWLRRHCIFKIRIGIDLGECPGPILADNISPHTLHSRKVLCMEIMRISKSIHIHVIITLVVYLSSTYTSPLNMFKAFKAKACLQPATSKPVSSRLLMVFDTTFAAFQRVVPHKPTPSPFYNIKQALIQIGSTYISTTYLTEVSNYTKMPINQFIWHNELFIVLLA